MLAARHGGYRRLRRPVDHRRDVLFIRPGHWTVVDRIEGSGEHRIVRRFHFPRHRAHPSRRHDGRCGARRTGDGVRPSFRTSRASAPPPCASRPSPWSDALRALGRGALRRGGERRRWHRGALPVPHRAAGRGDSRLRLVDCSAGPRRRCRRRSATGSWYAVPPAGGARCGTKDRVAIAPAKGRGATALTFERRDESVASPASSMVPRRCAGGRPRDHARRPRRACSTYPDVTGAASAAPLWWRRKPISA